MSASLSAVAKTLFDAEVKADYQSSGFRLRNAFRMKTGVVGDTVQFPKVGSVVSVPAAFMESVTLQDPGFSPVTVALAKYVTPVGVDKVQEMTVNFDARRECASLVSKAMGRRSDQICINALNAGTYTAANTFSDDTLNMNYDRFTALVEFFEDGAVDPDNRFVAMSANNLRSMLKDDKFINEFYSGKKPIDRGPQALRDALGINIIIIPSMVEGGLPKSGNIRSVFAWHKMSVGMGIGYDFRTEINYLPKETTNLINGIFYANATVIDNGGIYKIECDETASYV